jgi:uncharacterized protein YndB with AHSA1/START domain
VDGNTVSVERVIKAPPDEIFALLADAGKHASFDGSESVNHASQQSVPLSMGAKFGMAMRGRKETLFIPYRTTNTVIEYEPDRRIAWQTTAMGGLLGGRVWRYELSPADTGTLVREIWDVSQDKQKWMITSGSMPPTDRGRHARQPGADRQAPGGLVLGNRFGRLPRRPG